MNCTNHHFNVRVSAEWIVSNNATHPNTMNLHIFLHQLHLHPIHDTQSFQVFLPLPSPLSPSTSDTQSPVFRLQASSTIMICWGLNIEPWCTPTCTSKLTTSSSFILTAVVTASYIAPITVTSHSSSPRHLKAYLSGDSKGIPRFFYFSKYLSCIPL